MMALLTSLLPSLFSLGGKLIEDKDKRAEFAFKVQEMAFKQMEVLISAKTYPWVDALVKMAYASKQIVKGLFRPVVSAGLFVYGMINPDMLQQLHALGIAGDAGIVGVFGAFPAWMKSRHDEKKKKPNIDAWED